MSCSVYHVLVQAREGSTRLPAKVLSPLGKETLIESVISRFDSQKCTVLTGTIAKNRALKKVVSSLGYQIIFGDDLNVFQRYVDFARNSECKYLIRVTGDNPFVVYDCIDSMVELMDLRDLDYCISSDIPIGCALEVIRRTSLLELESSGADKYTQEHVTPEFYRENSSWRWAKYSCGFFELVKLRLTVDTPEDLQLVNTLCEYFDRHCKDITLQDIRRLYSYNPDFFQINQNISQRSYRELE